MADKSKPMLVVADDYADVDGIGYQAHGSGLVQMIRSVRPERGAFTIGVFGEWGQGKTSMLRQIKKTLEDTPPNADEDVATVWFNPWRFAGEEHPIIPFLHTVVAALEAFKTEPSKKKTLAKIGKRLDIFIQKMAAAPVALAYGLTGEIKVPLLLKTKFDFGSMIDESRRQEERIDAKAKAAEKEGDGSAAEKYESLYYSLSEELQKAATGLGLRIVVFIDDLDRCLPEKAVELLEGLKVLLDLPGFVFVIGVAREVIERGVRVRYKELYTRDGADVLDLERDYLDKIIQFPFALPPADPARLRAHVADQLRELEAVEPFVDTILAALGGNPRSLKRFINAVSFTLWVVDEKEREEETEKFAPELLIKMCLLAFQFPALYVQLGKSPHHLVRIQEILWSLSSDGDAQEVDAMYAKAEEQNTSFPEIDQWLKRGHAAKLGTILQRQSRTVGKDRGFGPAEEVSRYVSLLTAAISPDTEVKRRSGRGDHFLSGVMKDRMRRIEPGTFTMGDDETGRREVTLDGFWLDGARGCRSACRFGFGPGDRYRSLGLGFRLSRSLLP